LEQLFPGFLAEIIDAKATVCQDGNLSLRDTTTSPIGSLAACAAPGPTDLESPPSPTAARPQPIQAG